MYHTNGPGLDEAFLEGLGDHREELFLHAIFSRWFVLTYQAGLVGVVLLFTARHWHRKHYLCRRISSDKRQSTEDLGENQIASKSPDERTALLSSSRTVSLYSLRRIKTVVRSAGLYQPKPLPIVCKALPSNATTLLVLLLLGLNTFYLVYNSTSPFRLAVIGVSDRAALLFIANLPWLYFLAAKNQPIKLLIGTSYEHLNILHRRLGELLCLLAVLHAAGVVCAWYWFIRPSGIDVAHFLMYRIIGLGAAAFVVYATLYLTSLASFREWNYELFLGSHVFMQLAALVLVFFHARGARIYVAIALAVFLVDRIIFRWCLKGRSIRADLTVLEDGETVLVSADWSILSRWSTIWTSILGLDVKYGWKAGEHVFLTVPALGGNHTLQCHPFTIASAAPENDQQHAWFNLIVRAQDGFTQDLLKHARNHFTTTVRIDGPYGSMHALEILRASETAIVVAAGSGIAVAYPLIWTLLHNMRSATEATPRRRICLVWVVHDASHISWLGHERLDELREKGLRIVIPAPSSKAGRPDVGAIVRDAVEESSDGLVDRVGVVVSGPDGMNRVVRNTCAQLIWEGRDLDVAVEKFGW